jgi:hypothetical protein
VRAAFAAVRDESFVDVDASGSVEEVHQRVRRGPQGAMPHCRAASGGRSAPWRNGTQRGGGERARSAALHDAPPRDARPLALPFHTQLLPEALDTVRRCREGQPLLALWNRAPLASLR